MTFPKRLEDHASYESFTNEVDGRLVYTEDIEFGYRSYEKNGVEPAYRKFIPPRMVIHMLTPQPSATACRTPTLTGRPASSYRATPPPPSSPRP